MKNKITKSDDGTYTVIHESGVQTSIKTGLSGSYSDDLKLNRVNKQKYSVVISSSLGCPMDCQFCHLTGKKQYKKLTPVEVSAIACSAISEVVKLQPELSRCYIKLCFMGEGEFIFHGRDMYLIVYAILSDAIGMGYAVGVDGVDIGSVGVKSKTFVNDITNLNNDVVDLVSSRGWMLNPNNHNSADRSIVRMFWSMHQAIDEKREIIMPRTETLENMVAKINAIRDSGINVVIHYTFIDGLNDSFADVNALVKFINTHDLFSRCEFRLLRYNTNGALTETEHLEEIVGMLRTANIGSLKIQHSAGAQVRSACGMFVTNDEE